MSERKRCETAKNLHEDQMKAAMNLWTNETRLYTSPTEEPTLRDQFAMSAMGTMSSLFGEGDSYIFKAAQSAYKVADAMLKAREE